MNRRALRGTKISKDLPQRYVVMNADADAVKAFIAEQARQDLAVASVGSQRSCFRLGEYLARMPDYNGLGLAPYIALRGRARLQSFIS